MARTRADWNADIDIVLAPLGLSSSAVAEWKTLRDICVSTAMTQEQIYELLKADLETTLSTKQFGLFGWYVAVARAFQYTDSLVVINGVPGYAVIDTSKQIVAHASVRELTDLLVMKVAKLSGADLVALTGPELNAFTTYIRARKPPGINLNIESYAGDQIYYELDVRYDPLYDPATLQAAILAAMDAFRLAFPFDSVFYKAQLQQAIMAVPGVKDVVLYIDVTFSTGGVISDLSDYTELPSGYFNYDTSGPFNLLPAP